MIEDEEHTRQEVERLISREFEKLKVQDITTEIYKTAEEFLEVKKHCSVKGDVAYLCERYVGGVGSVYNFIDGDQGYRIGFQSGKGIDQKHCKRTYAAEEDKVIHNSRNHNLYDRYIRIPAVEKS